MFPSNRKEVFLQTLITLDEFEHFAEVLLSLPAYSQINQKEESGPSYEEAWAKFKRSPEGWPSGYFSLVCRPTPEFFRTFPYHLWGIRLPFFYTFRSNFPSCPPVPDWGKFIEREFLDFYGHCVVPRNGEKPGALMWLANGRLLIRLPGEAANLALRQEMLLSLKKAGLDAQASGDSLEFHLDKPRMIEVFDFLCGEKCFQVPDVSCGSGFTGVDDFPTALIKGEWARQTWHSREYGVQVAEAYAELQDYMCLSTCSVSADVWGFREVEPDYLNLIKCLLLCEPGKSRDYYGGHVGWLRLGPKGKRRSELLAYLVPGGLMIAARRNESLALDYLNEHTPWKWAVGTAPVMVRKLDFEAVDLGSEDMPPFEPKLRLSPPGQESVAPAALVTPAAKPVIKPNAEAEACLARLETLDFFESYPAEAKERAVEFIATAYGLETDDEASRQRKKAALAANPLRAIGFVEIPTCNDGGEGFVGEWAKQSLGLFQPTEVWSDFRNADGMVGDRVLGVLEFGFTLNGKKYQRRFFEHMDEGFNPETHRFVARAFKEQSPFSFFPVGKEMNPFTICTRAAMERLVEAGMLTTVPKGWKDYLFNRKLEVWQVEAKEFLEPKPGGWQAELMELWKGEFLQDDVEPTEKERRAEAKRLSGWYWTDAYDPQGPYPTEEEARKAAEES